MSAGLAVLPRTAEVAGIDGGGGQPAGLAGVAAAPRAPDLAGRGEVLPGDRVAHLLEGVAPVAEVLRALGDEFEFAGVDLGAVLGVHQVAHLRGEPVDAAVEAADLGVEGVDDAPEQVLALVGELEAVGGDAFREDAERFADRVHRVVCVPDLAGVELVAFRSGAEELRVLADHGGRGPGIEGVDIEGHELGSLRLSWRRAVRERSAVAVCWDTLGAGEPPGPE